MLVSPAPSSGSVRSSCKSKSSEQILFTEPYLLVMMEDEMWANTLDCGHYLPWRCGAVGRVVNG